MMSLGGKVGKVGKGDIGLIRQAKPIQCTVALANE